MHLLQTCLGRTVTVSFDSMCVCPIYAQCFRSVSIGHLKGIILHAGGGIGS